MKVVVDGWKQTQKLLPELERISSFFSALEAYKQDEIVSFSPQSYEAFLAAGASIEDLKRAIQKDLRIIEAELRRVA